MKTYIVGNWKMNQGPKEIKEFFDILKNSGESFKGIAGVAPQYIHLSLVKPLADPLDIMVGAQNCAGLKSGAYTGEVSPHSLAEMNYSFVILGHSERRSLYHESSETLIPKVQQCIENDLGIIFCCGETLEERESDKAFEVVKSQLKEVFSKVAPNDFSRFLVAYEPVWAIGTGRTASPEQAQEMHAFIRKILKDEISFPADNISILYGGSVKPSNITTLLSQKDINGALVGGASLKGDDFLKLCQAVNKE